MTLRAGILLADLREPLKLGQLISKQRWQEAFLAEKCTNFMIVSEHLISHKFVPLEMLSEAHGLRTYLPAEGGREAVVKGQHSVALHHVNSHPHHPPLHLLLRLQMNLRQKEDSPASFLR